MGYVKAEERGVLWTESKIGEVLLSYGGKISMDGEIYSKRKLPLKLVKNYK